MNEFWFSIMPYVPYQLKENGQVAKKNKIQIYSRSLMLQSLSNYSNYIFSPLDYGATGMHFRN